MEPLTKDDFVTHITYVREDLSEVKRHLSQLNGRTRTNEQAIAVLTDRSDTDSREAHKGGMLAGGVVTAIAAALELARHWFSK